MSSYSSRFKVQRYVFFSDEGNFTCKKFYFFLSFPKGLASARIEAVYRLLFTSDTPLLPYGRYSPR